MNVETFREYCLKKPGVSEHLPFDERTLVFKVGGKMFALCDIERFTGANLKCDPEWAVELREQYEGITPGYHMNKKHWNTVAAASDVDQAMFIRLIDHSYELIKSSLPKKEREKL
jgi:predicted DNA-binding protein (MmcQ/YjbR family)